MNIVEKAQDEILPKRTNYHVLTYAEEGFSPLNIHAKGSGLSEEVLKEYASRSNKSDRVITMFPISNISLLPRRFIRESASSLELYAQFLDFFDLNASKIKAKKFIFDFRTHKLQGFVLKAIYMLDGNDALGNIEEIVIIA